MANFAFKKYAAFLLLLFVKENIALFCYSCYKVSANLNYLCNENEPMKCGPYQNKCGTENRSGSLQKGCIPSCPSPGRGDGGDGTSCYQCDTDLCNQPAIGVLQETLIQPSELLLSPYNYAIFWQPATFWEARIKCTARGEELAVIRDARVQDFFLREIKEPMISEAATAQEEAIHALWIGGKSVERDTWVWTDDGSYIPLSGDKKCRKGTEKFQNWAQGYPTFVSTGRHNCGLVRIGSDMKWIDASCGKMAAGFICQSKVYTRGADENDFVQSIVISSRTYTFHSALASKEEAALYCAGSGGQLADMQNQQLKIEVEKQLSYAIGSSAYWSEQPCETNPPNGRGATFSMRSCETAQPYICENVFSKTDCKNTPGLLAEAGTTSPVYTTRHSLSLTSHYVTSQSTSTHVVTSNVPTTSLALPETTSLALLETTSLAVNETTSTFPTSQYISTQAHTQTATTVTTHTSTVTTTSATTEISNNDVTDPYCKPETVERYGNVLFFPMTSYRSFVTSVEVCESGQPMGSIFCGKQGDLIRYDVTTLAFTPCNQTIEGILYQTATTSRGPSELNALTRDLRLLTSQSLTENNVTNTIDVLKLLDEMTRKGSEVTQKMMTDIIATASSIQKTVYTQQSVQGENGVTSLVESFLGRVTLEKKHPQYAFSTNQIRAKALEISKNQSQIDVTFSSAPDERGVPYITIKSETLSKLFKQKDNNSSKNIRTVFVGYNDASLFPSTKGNVDKVITATVVHGNEEKVSVPVSFAFARSNLTEEQKCLAEECSFYDIEKQTWSTKGCGKVEGYDESSTVHCACNHTTSFAVVLSYNSEEENLALDIASKVGLALCVLCLLATVILFFKLPELRRVKSSNIHTHLCICLIAAYVIFLFGVERTRYRPLCVAIAALIHYFLLAAWGWMAVESITMFRMFVSSFDRGGIKNSGKTAAVVYLLSGFIAIATVGGVVIAWFVSGMDANNEDCTNKDMWSNYVGDGYCWLAGPALYVGFMAIVGLVLIVNLVMAFAVIRAITWGRTKVQSTVDESPSLMILRAILVAVLMGVAWVTAIPVVASQNEDVKLVFAWVFAISTSFQGLFMFFFFCVRRKEIRHAWTYPIRNALCCKHGKKRQQLARKSGSDHPIKRWRMFSNTEKSESRATEMTARE